MFRLLALVFALMPGWAAALCTGEKFETYLTPQDRMEIDATLAALPFSEGNSWLAEKDGVTLTIMGTMHLPDPRHSILLDQVRPHLATADLLLVEATMQDQTYMQLYLANNPKLMYIEDGPTLPEVLDEPTWDAIQVAAQDLGIPSFLAAKMQPWYLVLALSIPKCVATEIMNGEGGLDALLMEEAGNLGVPTQALEPWQDMFALLTMGSFEEQVDALRMSLLAPRHSNALMVSMIEAYFEGQAARAWLMTYYTREFLPEVAPAVFDEQMAMLEDLMLNQRNQNWIPVIEAAATQHDTIVLAFGAAHLFGELGVLNLLETAGWTIRPL